MNEFYRKLANLSPERRALFEQKLIEQGLQSSIRQSIPPRPEGTSSLPLSFAQRRLWFMQQLEPDNTAYNMTSVLRIRGRLDRTVLGNAVDALVERHEPLRTRFELHSDGEPRQIIDVAAPVVLDFADLCDESNSEETARNHIEAMAGGPYDLTRPPFRASLLQLAEEDHLVAFGMHHIASDRWSMAVFVRELFALYHSGLTDKEPALPPQTIQYADWALWQRDALQQERLEEQLGYWTQSLSGELPVLDLPFDRPRGVTASFRGAHYPVALGSDLAKRLRDLAKHKQVSLFTLLLTSFKVLLHRYTDSDDIIVGSEVTNRDRPEMQGMIGPLVNTLVLRSDLSGDPDFDTVLKQVNDVARNGMANQDVSFERVVEAINPERRLNEMTPLFQAKFDLQHTAIDTLEMEGIVLERYPFVERSAKNELRFNLQDLDPDVGGRIEYSSDLFDEETIARLVGHFETLLRAIVEDSSQRLSRLPLLSEEEQQAAIAAAPGPRLDKVEDLCIHQLFELQAARTPDAPAVVDDKTTVTYRDLDEQAKAIATALANKGVGPDHCVGVCMRRTPGMIAALLGVLKAGGAYVPLDPEYPAERLCFIADDAKLNIVLTDADQLPFTSDRTLTVLNPDHLPSIGEAQLKAPTPGNLAYVIYTSGSTGKPKGVAIEHRSTFARLLWARDQFTDDELAGVLASTSICFDLSVFEIFAPLAWGGKVVLSDNLMMLPNLPSKITITLVNTVPSLLRELLKQHTLPRSVLTVTLCGEPLTRTLLDMLREDPCEFKIYNLYGPSEDTTYSTCAALHGPEFNSGPVPIGTPLPDTTAYVLDRAGRPQPEGLTGELYLGGAGLARGYLDRPEQTQERFLPAPFAAEQDRENAERLYRTGDRVRRRSDGMLEFLGRSDQQIKIRGFRIEIGEIENCLEQQPDVQEAAVVATGMSGDPDRHLVAYLTPKSGKDVDESAVRERVAQSLPAHLVPSLWCTLPELPHLPNGKIDRNALPALAPQDVQVAQSVYIAPRDTTEAGLATIWSEVLGVERVGIEDNFFELGGHSLLAIQIVARIESEFGLTLPLKALFQSPTVTSLAETLIELSGEPVQSARAALVPDPEKRHEPFPLTDIQYAYWLGRNQAFELGSVGSHAYREFDVEGLDLETAESALRQLIERHDMLRAIVEPDGRQRVLKDVPAYELPIADLRGVDDAEEQLLEIRERLSHHVFAADHWPLFHIEAAKLDDHTNRLYVSFDVLIGDAWSFQVLGKEFSALLMGKELLPLNLTFRDYVLADRAYEQSAAYQQAMAHWRSRIDTLPPAPELPLARSPAQIDTPHFQRRTTGLSTDDWTAFKQRASAAGLTPTSAAMAVFAEVLARWSQRSDFTLNLTLFNRQPLHSEVRQIVGDFTASLLLGIDMSGVDDFSTRARRMQDRLWEDLDHRAVSGVQVLRELTRSQNRSSAALMPVVFTSTLNQAIPAGQERPFSTRLVNSVSQTPQVYLDHQASEVGGALVCNWDAIEELFPSGLLDTMFAAYQQLLEALAHHDSAWKSVPELYDGGHYNALNQAAVLPLADADRLLHEGFFEQAAQRPERIALIADDIEFTYGDVGGRALALAATLQELGAMPNQLVAVSLEKGADQIIACLGVLAAGAAYVPIDPDLPRDRRWQLIEDIEASLAICAGGEWPEELHCVTVPDTAGGTPIGVAAKSTDLAYVIFTSGSTGRPKGVMIDHRGAMNTVLDINLRFDISQDDRVFALSSLSFDLSVYDIFGPLAIGGALVVPSGVETENTAHWRGLLSRHKVTVWNSVPSLAQLLATELGDNEEPLTLRLIMMSGDWIPVSLPDTLRTCLPMAEIVSLGGATEASVWSIYYPVKSVASEWNSIPYGTPLANQRWYIFDEDMRLCPPWVPGRLFIGGIGVARGYWSRPDLTAENFVPDPFATREAADAGALHLYDTGDLGCYRDDGTLEFLGRKDFQVKINGFRIELGEIEASLLQHPSVAEAVVAARGEPASLAAYVAPRLDIGDAALRFDIKAQQAGIRPEQSGEQRLALPNPESADENWLARQSHRRFLSVPVSMEKLGGLLATLRSVRMADAPLPKHRYPSAGSLYPVQTYLLVREGRLAGLDAGWYYYHPSRHDLVAVASADAASTEAVAGSNSALMQDSAFTLFMVGSTLAVKDLYAERARDFCMLEAGYMGQLLMNNAPALHIGLCPLGGIDADALKLALGLEDDHLPLHAICGGGIEPVWSDSWQAVAPSSGSNLADRLTDFLSQRLPAYMIPHDIMLLERLPLTSNGKVDRKALPQPGIRLRTKVAPATPVEEQVLALWQELLDQPELSVEDHFFQVGGNSLTAMQLLTRLQQEFAIELSIAQLFSTLTPRTQAALIAKAIELHPADAALEASAIPAVKRQSAAAMTATTDRDVDDMLAKLMSEQEETAS